ncbi:MAG: tryptophan synthase subunit alpha [Saprospiraceae bacterium]
MNRIIEHFKNKPERNLNIYFTAGFPELNDTGRIIETLSKNKVDLIEIGMPYSDPMADGPVIQSSSSRSLKNGMKLNILLEQLRGAK